MGKLTDIGKVRNRELHVQESQFCPNDRFQMFVLKHLRNPHLERNFQRHLAKKKRNAPIGYVDPCSFYRNGLAVVYQTILDLRAPRKRLAFMAGALCGFLLRVLLRPI